MCWHCLVLGILAFAFSGGGLAQERRNWLGDPFEQISSGWPGCPQPAGPLWTEAEARAEAHWRVERGTSCYRSGRCRLPNAYLYAAELMPRLQRFLAQDERFADSSVWLLVRGRTVFVQGCLVSAEQGLLLERQVQLVDDVEAVVPQWTLDPARSLPYPVAKP